MRGVALEIVWQGMAVKPAPMAASVRVAISALAQAARGLY
jgi:hypothetical protein